MRLTLTLLLLLLIGIRTNVKAQKKIDIVHFNITVAQDLSNRINSNLYKRHLTDIEIIKILGNQLWPNILRYRRAENQKDKFGIDFVNKGLISQYNVNTEKLLIDFGRFEERQLDRIGYILARKGYDRTLSKDLLSMSSELAKVNTAAAKQNFGADIWTYLNEGVSSTVVLAPEKSITYRNITYTNKYRNVLVLLTDGYIEAGIYGQGFDLSKNTINKFRTAYVRSKQVDMAKFLANNPKFRIKTLPNPLLKDLEVLVLEMYDRSMSSGGSATVHPTDMEIMKVFWNDWLKSKVKRLELKPYFKSKDEAEKTFRTFLEV